MQPHYIVHKKWTNYFSNRLYSKHLSFSQLSEYFQVLHNHKSHNIDKNRGLIKAIQIKRPVPVLDRIMIYLHTINQISLSTLIVENQFVIVYHYPLS